MVTLICAQCGRTIDANKSYSGRPGNAFCRETACTKAYLESSRDLVEHAATHLGPMVFVNGFDNEHWRCAQPLRLKA